MFKNKKYFVSQEKFLLLFQSAIDLLMASKKKMSVWAYRDKNGGIHIGISNYREPSKGVR